MKWTKWKIQGGGKFILSGDETIMIFYTEEKEGVLKKDGTVIATLRPDHNKILPEEHIYVVKK